MIIKLP